jgi:hypothetical protein
MADGIFIDSVQLDTLRAIDDFGIHTDSAAPFDVNSIGEKKKFTMSCSLTGPDFSVGSGQEIRFVPGLFIEKYTSAPYSTPNPLPCYKWFIPTAYTTGVKFTGTLISSLGPPSDNRIRNLIVQLEVFDDTHFAIYLTFFMTQDMGQYLPSSAVNRDRFLRSHVSDTTELPTSPIATSVYGSSADRALGVYLRITALLDGATYSNEYQYDFSAGWYGREAGDVASIFNTPLWGNTVGGVQVSSFSTIANNTFRFRVTVGGGLTASMMCMYLVRTDQSNNSITFDSNYQLTPLAVTLSNIGVNYTGTVTITPAMLTLGASYRVLAIAYSAVGPRVTSYISLPWVADSVVPWDGTGAAITSTWRDYHSDYPGGTMSATIEERMRLTVAMDYSSDAFKNNIITRLGITGTNDIRRYLTSVRFRIYERRTDQAGTLYVTDRKDVVYDTTITRQLDGSYNTLNGLQFSGGLDTCFAQLDFRNRYESHLQNMYTLYDDVAQPVPLSTQDWGARTFFVEAIFDLYYHDAPTPFTDRLVVENKLHVNDYYNLVEFTLTPDAVEACTTDDVCFEATFAGAVTEEYKLITTLELAPGQVALIGENDTYTYGMLPQLTVPAFFNQEEDFGTTDAMIAKFCIDCDVLSPGTYKIAAIAKRVTESDRITNNMEDRITNNFEIRLTNG